MTQQVRPFCDVKSDGVILYKGFDAFFGDEKRFPFSALKVEVEDKGLNHQVVRIVLKQQPKEGQHWGCAGFFDVSDKASEEKVNGVLGGFAFLGAEMPRVSNAQNATKQPGNAEPQRNAKQRQSKRSIVATNSKIGISRKPELNEKVGKSFFYVRNNTSKNAPPKEFQASGQTQFSENKPLEAELQVLGQGRFYGNAKNYGGWLGSKWIPGKGVFISNIGEKWAGRFYYSERGGEWCLDEFSGQIESPLNYPQSVPDSRRLPKNMRGYFSGSIKFDLCKISLALNNNHRNLKYSTIHAKPYGFMGKREVISDNTQTVYEIDFRKAREPWEYGDNQYHYLIPFNEIDAVKWLAQLDMGYSNEYNEPLRFRSRKLSSEQFVQLNNGFLFVLKPSVIGKPEYDLVFFQNGKLQFRIPASKVKSMHAPGCLGNSGKSIYLLSGSCYLSVGGHKTLVAALKDKLDQDIRSGKVSRIEQQKRLKDISRRLNKFYPMTLLLKDEGKVIYWQNPRKRFVYAISNEESGVILGLNKVALPPLTSINDQIAALNGRESSVDRQLALMGCHDKLKSTKQHLGLIRYIARMDYKDKINAINHSLYKYWPESSAPINQNAGPVSDVEDKVREIKSDAVKVSNAARALKDTIQSIRTNKGCSRKQKAQAKSILADAGDTEFLKKEIRSYAKAVKQQYIGYARRLEDALGEARRAENRANQQANFEAIIGTIKNIERAAMDARAQRHYAEMTAVEIQIEKKKQLEKKLEAVRRAYEAKKKAAKKSQSRVKVATTQHKTKNSRCEAGWTYNKDVERCIRLRTGQSSYNMKHPGYICQDTGVTIRPDQRCPTPQEVADGSWKGNQKGQTSVANKTGTNNASTNKTPDWSKKSENQKISSESATLIEERIAKPACAPQHLHSNEASAIKQANSKCWIKLHDACMDMQGRMSKYELKGSGTEQCEIGSGMWREKGWVSSARCIAVCTHNKK